MKFSQPSITSLERDAVANAIARGHLTTGVITSEFEEAFSAKYGYAHTVAVNSGTSALMLGLLALGIGPGDEVICPPYAMVASVNCVLSVGATPVFADIDRTTYNITPESVLRRLTPKTRCVLPVDIFGVPADVRGIRSVLPSTVRILQDSIEALGSTHAGKPIGSFADLGCFGFFPNKQITTGEGGLLYGEDYELVRKARLLSRHGVDNATMYDQAFGYNMRLTDMQSAMGLVQLSRFDEIQAMVSKASALLDAALPGVRKQRCLPGDTATWFIYSAELPEGIDKRKFIQDMKALGIPVKPYFVSLHRLPHLSRPEYCPEPLPVCEEVDSRTVALPLHWELTQQEVQSIAEAYARCTGV